MSITTAYCPSCGQAVETGPGTLCAQCQASFPSTQSPQANWLTGAEISPMETEKPGSPWLDLLWAFLIWGVSGAFLMALDAALRVSLWALGQKIPEIEITRGAAIFTLLITMVFQLVALSASWLVVTRLGKKPFLQTLGWHWHPQFRWVHAVGGAALMFGVAVALSQLLPHRETDMEKILKLGTSVRLLVIVLAVLMAPVVEEVVYRGVVYSSVERLWGKAAGVFVVTGIFGLVHVPQYWGSVAAITAIVALSLVLTLIRAWTGSLLPCVVMHLVYNGIQGVLLVVAPDAALNTPTEKTAVMLVNYWLGGN